MNEDRIDEWLRKFQREHKELVQIGVDELRDLAYALHNDIPLGYEASMRLGNWLLNATLGGEQICHATQENYEHCKYSTNRGWCDTSRYAELFGTPERAARTLSSDGRHADCDDCMIRDGCYAVEMGCLVEDYDALLEWLKGEAE